MIRLFLIIFIVLMPSMLLAESGSFSNDNNLTIDTIYFSGDFESASKVNLPFNQSALDKSINNILKPFLDSGYYYASAEIVQVEKNTDKVRLHIIINRGPLLTIGEVVIFGLKRSNYMAIKRLTGVSESDTLNSHLLSQAELAVRRIDYVNFKPPIEVMPKPGFTKADLVFNFEEKKPISIIAGGGYLPENKVMVWNLDFKFNNLFGSGRKVSIKSEKKEKGHTVLELFYRQFVFGKGLSTLEFNASTRDYRDLFYEFSIESSLKADLLRNLVTGVSLGYRSVEPNQPVGSFSSYSAEFSIHSSNLIDQYNPKQGYTMDWALEYAYRKYDNDTLQLSEGKLSSFNETRININLGWYQTIFKGIMGYSGIKYWGYETREELPPVSELFLIGGSGTLRGFRSEQFSALRAAIVTIEPRYRFNNGNFFLFYEGAYLNNRSVESESTTKTNEDYHQGFGFGIALRDSNRYVKLSLGWNKELPFDQPYLSIILSTDI